MEKSKKKGMLGLTFNLGLIPPWFYPNGRKMYITELMVSEAQRKLVIGGKTAQLTIIRSNSLGPQWSLSWKIKNPWGWVEGLVRFETNELKAAFGLTDDRGDSPDIIKRFNADAAVQGKWIKKGSHLNIAGPSTGLDGASDISISLTLEIKDAIKQITQEVA